MDMKNMKKKEYDGLQTTRLTVESPVIMATSRAKAKVKTDTTTKEWEEMEENTQLSTTITSSFD